MKKLFLALVAVNFAASSAAAQPAGPLSLSEAIALGLEHNRSLANTALDVEKSEKDIADARSHRLPTFKIEMQGSQLLRPVDVLFAGGVFGTFPGIGPVPATDTKITTPASMNVIFSAEAQQPLTQLRKLNLNVRLYETSREYEREQLRNTRLTLVNEIKRLYYSIAQTKSSLDATTHTLAMLREIDRVVVTRIAQQTALKSDGLTVQSRLAQTELTRLTLRHTLSSQKEQLNQMLGRDLRTAFDVMDVPDTLVEEVALETAQTRAMEARPDVKQARVKLQQAELARRVAKADYLPDVGLAFSYLSPMTIEGAPRQIMTAAIQFQWEPFDWGRRGRAVATKDIEIRQATNAVREVEDRAVLEINTNFRRLEQARAQLRATRIDQEGARENARMRVVQYEVKATLLSDVLQTQATLADTDNQYQQALATFWSARADFEKALGEEVTQ